MAHGYSMTSKLLRAVTLVLCFFSTTLVAGTDGAHALSPRIAPVLPGAPTAVSGVESGGRVTISWAPPSSDGGSMIISYTATATPGGSSCSSDGTNLSCSLSDLTGGTSYTFKVVAINAVGAGPPSLASSALVVVTAPAIPTNVSAQTSHGLVTVSWSAPPANGGSPITGYVVTANPGGSLCTTPDGLSTTCTMMNLLGGTAYSFTVAALNAIGSSSDSSPSNLVTPVATAPNAPSGVVATSGISAATVSWLAPDSNGASPLTSFSVSVYLVTSNVPTGKGCSTPDGDTLTCTVSGLTRALRYTFRVTASNTIGSSPLSVASNVVTIADAPTAPLSVRGVAAKGKATITWLPPASDGGSPIATYDVSAHPGGQSCSSARFSCVVLGLSGATSYTFSVVATNAVGTGPRSLASPPVILPRSAPDAPTGLSAHGGNAAALITWNAPLASGGSPITGYRVTSDPDLKSCSVSATLRTCAISGLRNGVSYTFLAVAINALGTSSPSMVSNAVIPAIPPTVPSSPTGVHAMASLASATVTWTPSSSNGGSPISSYTATATPGGQFCTSAASDASACIITGLFGGTSYVFSVVASNTVGRSVASLPSSALTLAATAPSPPTSVHAVAGHGLVVVSWSAPTYLGGVALTSYLLCPSTSTTGCTTLTSLTTTFSVTGLTNGTAYSFNLQAINSVGRSAVITTTSATPLAPVNPPTPPSAPTRVVAIAGSGQATVSWNAPTTTGGSAIKGYVVTATPGGANCSTSGALSCTVLGLLGATSYTFSVAAVNVVAFGPASVASQPIVIGATAPGAPVNVVAVARSHAAVISWSYPLSNGGSPITGFIVTASPGGLRCVPLTSPTCTVSGLTSGVHYTFSVVAINVIGPSASSVASNVVTPATVSASAPLIATRLAKVYLTTT